jgi:uncharacterized membrane protein YadS
VIARLVHGALLSPAVTRAISDVFIAVVLGLTIRQVIALPHAYEPGIRFALQRVLRLGIILLGLRLSLQDVAATGLSALALIVTCMAVALTLAYLAGRALRIPPRLAALIGVGTAICGNTGHSPGDRGQRRRHQLRRRHYHPLRHASRDPLPLDRRRRWAV